MNRLVRLSLAGVLLFGPFLPSAIAYSGSPSIFNIRSYGAAGDGKTLDSPSINQAINACAAAGGGTVYFPAGTYLSGSIHLKSNIHLSLAVGSVILAAPQAMNAYDPAEPFDGKGYQDGGHSFFHNSLIWGENLDNVSITGPGTINGANLVSNSELLDEWSGFSHPPKPVVDPSLSDSAVTPPDDTAANDASSPEENIRRIGNKSLCLKLCRHVLIRDVTIIHGGHFAILVTGCDGLTIDKVTIDTNRDGMDIDCCQNVAISNCRVNSPNDDGICPKSTYALGHAVITENLAISNCQVSGFQEGTLIDGTMRTGPNHLGRIKFGTESTGGFRNCTITNCTFRACDGLALEEVDGGIMENIVVSKLRMTHLRGYPIYITTGSRNRGPAATSISTARNIQISDVVASLDDGLSSIEITGLPQHPIEGVRLKDIKVTFHGGGTATDSIRVPPEINTGYPDAAFLGVMPAYGLFARHVKDLELTNVQVSSTTSDFRPAISCLDVDDLQIDNFKAAIASGVAPTKFTFVTNLSIRNSPDISPPSE